MRHKRVRLARARRSSGLTQEELAYRLGVDRSTVARWEAGQSEPSAWLRPKLAKLLGVSLAGLGTLIYGQEQPHPRAEVGGLGAILGVRTDAASGLSDPRGAVERLAAANRKQFLRTAALGVGAAALTPVAALWEGGAPTPVPARVGATEIAQVRATTRAFRSWDSTHGVELAREAVLAQLRWSAGLLDATCPSSLRPELFSAVGDLANFAGYKAGDEYADEEAGRVLRFALGCAEEADDWQLRSAALRSMAFHAIWTGRPDEGLTLAEQALVRADRLTPTERAIGHTTRARALATMRRARDTLAAVGTADDHFAHADPANDPPFLASYDAAVYTGVTGRALADLAMHGRDPREATGRLTAAIAGSPAGSVGRTIVQVKLASLTMATGDPVEAAALGTAVLNAGAVRSRRITDDLRALARHATRHPKVDQVAVLRQRITTTVLAS